MSQQDRAIELRVITRRRWQRVVAEDAGRDISHLSFGPMPLRVGPAGKLSMAGIAGVATEPEYRQRGLARRVFARGMEEITQAGYSCVGLYTGSDIIAHRLYCRFGFVDTHVPEIAVKLLNPGQYVLNRLSSLLQGEAVAPELRSWRVTVRVHLPPHHPLCVRIDRGDVRPLESPPERIDLSLTSTAATLGKLFWGVFSAEYAETAKLLRWEGDETVWRQLASAIEARREVIKEGSM